MSGITLTQFPVLSDFRSRGYTSVHNRRASNHMTERTAKDLGQELERLMSEHLEHLRNRTFGWVSEEEYREQEARLRLIRELSADYLSALKRSQEES